MGHTVHTCVFVSDIMGHTVHTCVFVSDIMRHSVHNCGFVSDMTDLIGTVGISDEIAAVELPQRLKKKVKKASR